MDEAQKVERAGYGLNNVQRWFTLRGAIITATVGVITAIISTSVAVIAVRQTSQNSESDRLLEFRSVLYELNSLGREATQADGSAVCAPMGGSMGSLTIKQSHFEQYELAALNAFQLAEQIEELESETLAIAGALYNCGRLNESSAYANRLSKSTDYGVRFRAHLILGQIAYFRDDTKAGERHIQSALTIVSNEDNGVPRIQRGIMQVEANLIRGRMLAAMGRVEESIPSQESAYLVLESLPETNRVLELQTALDNLVIATKHESRLRFGSFQEYAKQIERRLDGSDVAQASFVDDNPSDLTMPAKLDTEPAPLSTPAKMVPE